MGVLVKANRKWLKAVLASEVRKLGPFFLALKLGKFSFFDNFFLDLADFWDLDNFWDLDDFPIFDNFPHFSIDSASSFTTATSLVTSICDDTVVFSIDVSDAAILLKP